MSGQTINWTTVAVPQEKKAELEEIKPGQLSWGEWIEALALNNDVGTVGGIDEETIHEAVKAGMVAAGEDEDVKTANVIADGLISRLRSLEGELEGLDDTVKQAAYEGARGATEHAPSTTPVDGVCPTCDGDASVFLSPHQNGNGHIYCDEDDCGWIHRHVQGAKGYTKEALEE